MKQSWAELASAAASSIQASSGQVGVCQTKAAGSAVVTTLTAPR